MSANTSKLGAANGNNDGQGTGTNRTAPTEASTTHTTDIKPPVDPRLLESGAGSQNGTGSISTLAGQAGSWTKVTTAAGHVVYKGRDGRKDRRQTSHGTEVAQPREQPTPAPVRPAAPTPEVQESEYPLPPPRTYNYSATPIPEDELAKLTPKDPWL